MYLSEGGGVGCWDLTKKLGYLIIMLGLVWLFNWLSLWIAKWGELEQINN